MESILNSPIVSWNSSNISNMCIQFAGFDFFFSRVEWTDGPKKFFFFSDVCVSLGKGDVNECGRLEEMNQHPISLSLSLFLYLIYPGICQSRVISKQSVSVFISFF